LDINYLNINLSIRPYAGGCKDHTTPRRTLIQRTEGNFIVPVIAKFSRWESAAPPPEIPPLGNLGMRLAKLGDYRLYLQFPQLRPGIFTFQPADGQLWIT
jgi:hypothetical protein